MFTSSINNMNQASIKQAERKSTAEVLASMATQTSALSGLDSLTGVPTRTTPTLTPTTMRNIEQTFLDLQEQVSHQNQAGFVPPVVQTPQQPPPPQFTHTQGNMMMVDTKSWGGGCAMLADSMSQSSDDSMMSMARSAPSVTPPAPGAVLVAAPAPRRNTGGRRPNKVKNISPEEEERRHVRRERNKMAAARCRKRRLDHTNELIEETEGLEEKKRNLQDEIQQLQSEKEDLEYLLEAHKTRCRLQREDSPPDVKPFCVVSPMPAVLPAMPPPISESDARIKNEQMEPMPRPGPRPRPTTLSVAPPYDPRKIPCSVPTTEVAGVPITTPTAGMPFNFESLMDGGTGLTPVSGPGPVTPSCASQQRSGSVNISDLASPDASKLVSL